MTGTRSVRSGHRRGGTARDIGATAAGTGAALTGAAAAACCVPVLSPLLVTVVGASGSVWLAGLKPYSLYLLGAALLLLTYNFWSVYRPPRACDVAGTQRGGVSRLERTSRVLLWFSAVVWAVSTSAYFAFN